MVIEKERSILSREYVIDVLLFLDGKKDIICGDFANIVKSGTTRKMLLRDMACAGLVSIRTIERPRKTYFVTLTSLGSAIATDVKRADDRMKGILPELDNNVIKCSASSTSGDTVKD